MEPPPVIASHNQPRAKDFQLRSLSAVVIGAVGFWGPLWYDSRIPAELDSRLGTVFIFTLPPIIAAAAWATSACRRAHRPHLLSAALLVIVWSPVLFFGLRIIGGLLSLASG
jgi:hypothetical protein